MDIESIDVSMALINTLLVGVVSPFVMVLMQGLKLVGYPKKWVLLTVIGLGMIIGILLGVSLFDEPVLRILSAFVGGTAIGQLAIVTYKVARIETEEAKPDESGALLD